MPSATPARATTSKSSPMAVRMKLTLLYYRTPWRASPETRLPAAHRAPVGSHIGEEVFPGTRRRLQAVPVQGELVHKLVYGRSRVGDTPWLGDHEDLPVLELLYVVYGLLETGTVVEQEAGGIEVLVVGDEVVAVLGGVGLDSGPLLVLRRESALAFSPYVGCSQSHGNRMIAWVPSGMIQDRLQTRRDVAQSGSALGWGPSGRRFKSGRPDFLRRSTAASVERRVLDTIYLLLGIIGFFLIIAIFFFGGFVLLDFLWGRRGGDA